MILINLLPYREERRKRRKAAFFAGLGVAALAGAGIHAAQVASDGRAQFHRVRAFAEFGRVGRLAARLAVDEHHGVGRVV